MSGTAFQAAIQHRCPVCSASPGEFCRDPTADQLFRDKLFDEKWLGKQLERFHSSRIDVLKAHNGALTEGGSFEHNRQTDRS